MSSTNPVSWIAFSRSKRLASGAPRDVAVAVKKHVDAHDADALLIFDAVTSQPIEIDLRGSLASVLKRLPEAEKPAPTESTERSPGRPKLGVVAREVTLLPRHWQWLAAQRGGASVALRQLVEEASRASSEKDRRRQAQESAYRFMLAMAGDRAGYEEATRALFAGDVPRLKELIAAWPRDIREHALSLAMGNTNDAQVSDTDAAPEKKK